MSYLQSFNNEIILVGDFNIDILSTSDTVRKYQNLVSSFGFSVLDADPTRVSATSSSCIDHIISNAKLNVQTVCCAINDHYGLAVEGVNICRSTFLKEKSDAATLKHLSNRTIS